MAKVDISIDTSKKNVDVKVDGKSVKDVHSIYIYTEETGYFSMEISQREDMEDMKKITRLVASEKDETWQENSSYSRDELKNLAEAMTGKEV